VRVYEREEEREERGRRQRRERESEREREREREPPLRHVCTLQLAVCVFVCARSACTRAYVGACVRVCVCVSQKKKGKNERAPFF